MKRNILFCGVGGQGIVLSSKLTAAAAMLRGEQVMSAETIGMAQKGGSVFSHLRIGNNVLTPMLRRGEADTLIAFEPGEAVRMLPYLKQGGSLIVSPEAVMPVGAALNGIRYDGSDALSYLKETVPQLIVADCRAACAATSRRCLNIAMLGVACRSEALGVSVQDLEEAIRSRVKPQFVDMNLKALHIAAGIGE